MISTSFIVFLAGFLLVGLLSVRKKRATTEDYLLAGRAVSPAVAGLSAMASSYSGWMFIGMIGLTYAMGVSAIWLAFGFLVGDFVMWFWVHERLRKLSARHKNETFSSVLSSGNGREHKNLIRVIAVISILFLGAYAAAQLTAGSKALHVIFGWDYHSGAIIGAVMVLAYSLVGGIRASIWTDVAQAVVMVFALMLMGVLSLVEIGGFSKLWQILADMDASLTSFTPPAPVLGLPVLYIIGYLAGGAAVIGQPHIMVRFMAIESPEAVKKARFLYFSTATLMWAGSMMVGLCARVLVPEIGQFDAELALPTLAMEMLPDVIVGLVLAGLFAATMSTADSLIIACSAALTQDLVPKISRSYTIAKIGTALITGIVLFIALTGPESVHLLVMLAWGGMGAMFGTLLFVRVLGQIPSPLFAMAMIAAALLAEIVWMKAGLGEDMLLVAPGIVAALGVFGVAKLMGQVSREKI